MLRLQRARAYQALLIMSISECKKGYAGVCGGGHFRLTQSSLYWNHQVQTFLATFTAVATGSRG